MTDQKKLEYYTPDPATILKLYKEMDSGPGWLELDWKCPGRRPPTPPEDKDQEEVEEQAPDDGKDLAFDFEDEFANTSSLGTPSSMQRRAPGSALKGSARKKTTSLGGVLSNMRRHKLEEDNMQNPEKGDPAQS